MKKIAILNRKGGVGKSTITFNLAGALDKNFNKRVLVVDCDSQCNTTDVFLFNESQLDSEYKLENNLYDYLVTGDDSNLIHPVRFQKNKELVSTNISIIPSSSLLLDNEIKDERFLADLLKKYEDDFDYCLIDCPPSDGIITTNILTAASYIFMPVEGDKFSISGFSLLLDKIEYIKETGLNPYIQIIGVCLNRMNGTRNMAKHYANVWEMLNDSTEEYIIVAMKNMAEIAHTIEFGTPVHYSTSLSPGVRIFDEIAEKIIEKIDEIENS